MIKLLLVDDKKDEREGIKNLINWSSKDIQIVAEAQNGLEGLELAKELKPDIIISDIIMPLMDGIKMVENIKNILPDIRVIFISCYEEIKFAISAIQLNASAYILKPIISSELLDAINKVVQSLGKNNDNNKEIMFLNKNINLLRKNYLETLLAEEKDDNEEPDLDLFDINLIGKYINIFIIEIDNYYDIVSNNSDAEIIKTLKQQSAEVLEVIKKEKNRFIIFFCSSNCEEQYYLEACSKFKDSLSYLDFQITIGIGIFVDNLMHIASSYQSALNALKYKFYRGKNKIIFATEVQSISQESHIEINIDYINKSLKEALLSIHNEKIDDLINQTFTSEINLSQNYIKSICITILNFTSLLLIEMNASMSDVFDKENILYEKVLNFETILDIRQWLKNILYCVQDFIKNQKNSKNNRIVQEIKAFLEKNYNVHLKQEDIAQVVSLSSTYANNIFKNETGMSFLNYQIKLRMEKAKELLADPKMKIYEISEQVGYWNKPYFSVLFKQYTGLTPKEYREKF